MAAVRLRLGPTVAGKLQDASGGSFLSTAIVLAVALVLGGLVMLTLRRQADKPVPVSVPQPEATTGVHWSKASRSRLRLARQRFSRSPLSMATTSARVPSSPTLPANTT